ncbi:MULTISPECIES: hypothetical protein [unclassified Vibrio]|uniref:hypothetical protein n=1 Tax=unclassified Vibrio TaxID=2614977 RepID=UPI0013611488|nr:MULTISPECIES: hypothetical protein [unclassified Vibrio]NAW60065.1 hypothetical protein [Vibrio sp. V36_P2S2PM302]NAX25978.1 hypothetical protein [Vibrio sp. V38_P2S17PM301]NAX30656.1 hypothetical protein [Vibrio sp. V37_P2S8PM304]
MILRVRAKEKCFYQGMLKSENAVFDWVADEEYIKLAKDQKKQIVDVLPSYLELVGNAKKFEFDDEDDNDGLELGTGGLNLVDTPEPEKNSRNVDEEKQREQLIREALTKLDHGNDDHWTDGGKVSLSALKDVAGFKVSRAELDAVAPEFERIQ